MGSFNFDGVGRYFEDRDIKGTAAQIEDEDFLIFFLIKTVGQGSSGGLINNALNVKPSNLASVFRRLALSVVKVGRYRDHSFGNGGTKLGLGVSLELL